MISRNGQFVHDNCFRLSDYGSIAVFTRVALRYARREPIQLKIGRRFQFCWDTTLGCLVYPAGLLLYVENESFKPTFQGDLIHSSPQHSRIFLIYQSRPASCTADLSLCLADNINRWSSCQLTLYRQSNHVAAQELHRWSQGCFNYLQH